MNQALIDELRSIVGADGVLYQPEEILVYEYDASMEIHAPDVVVLPRTTAQVSRVVKLAAEHNLPVVARGAGTGLAGGAVPLKGGILIVLTRMTTVQKIDYRNRRAYVEAGVINLKLVETVAKGGYTYAPDPGSGRASTIGGNIASNAGGPHCLAYGVTANHITGVKLVLPAGEVIETGSPLADSSGYDLTGLMCGSEGTLGIVTEATAQLMPQAEAVRTLLVVFKTNVEDASAAVSDIIAHGIVPTAMEMMDGMVCRAVEAAVQAGYPDDAAGVLLIEVEGLEDGLDETMAKIEEICRQHHASEVHHATSAAERAKLWTGRKSALGAMGRIAPNYYLEDGVVPRHKLPEVMNFVEETAKKYDLPIGNFFHAGDGNIHPTILFDRRDPDARARARQAADEILLACIKAGGTVSGEHGIGTEKQDYLSHLYNQDDLDAMADLKACFNPDGRLNPGKIFPKAYQPALTAGPSSSNNGADKARRQSISGDKLATRLEEVVGSDALLSGEAAAAYQVGQQSPAFVAQPGSVEEVSALMRLASDLRLAVSPWGGGTHQALGQPLSHLDLVISLERLNQVLEHHPSDLTAAVQAGATLQATNDAFGAVGQMLPLDAPLPERATLGGIVAAGALATGLRRLAYGTVRDMLLGVQVVRADGRIVRRGGMVVKNVAGYDMSRLQYGAQGTLGIVTQVNLKLFPRPESSAAALANFSRREQAGIVIDQLLASRLQPATIALFDSGLAGQLGLETPQPYWLLVRFDGRQAAVERQVGDTLAWMGANGAGECLRWQATQLDAAWPRLTNFGQQASIEAEQTLLRLNVPSAEVITALGQLEAHCGEQGLAGQTLTDAASGIIWLRLTAAEETMVAGLPRLHEKLLQRYPQTVIGAAPPELKAGLSIWGQPPNALALMRRIKSQFDPHHLLNPARYLFSPASLPQAVAGEQSKSVEVEVL
ncbi:MAG TPA: FAD-linked oxidase C-terminal domain-containing protein [Anaerolineae bacterium]|nr:FAD-linked oxidase C-terminal domain-containing protein [Anaerolineae bacterium]